MNVRERPIEQLIWAMDQWLLCPILDSFERSLVEDLKSHAAEGTFWDRGRELYKFFAPALASARDKALSTGYPKKWEEYASQH